MWKNLQSHIKIAETLSVGGLIPLGKHLLGAVYHLLHQVAIKLSANEPISTLGRPWWFIQMWLNLQLHKATGVILVDSSFPSNQSDDEEPTTRRCTSIGEAISIIWDVSSSGMTHYFNVFYNGMLDQAVIQFPYTDDVNNFEFPYKYQFNEIGLDNESTKIYLHTVTPCILPVNFIRAET